MTEHPYGWLSLLPPATAIVLAITTRRIILSLLAGVLVGALVTSHGNVLLAVTNTLEVQLWKTLVDESRLRVFSFTLLMGAMVGVIDRSAGMHGLVNVVSRYASTRRRGQLVTWVLGLFVFFDDYANTLLLGNSMRPLCDRLRISREKLAYLVDSTAAPVAGLALISTWVAIEINLVGDGLAQLPVGALELAADGDEKQKVSAVGLFVASIPYRFYVLLALVFVPIVALLGRDLGPMLAAERRMLREDAEQDVAGLASLRSPTAPDDGTPARWINAVLPIVVTIGVVVWLIYVTGMSKLTDSKLVQNTDAVAVETGDMSARPALRDIVGQADSSLALTYGALAGLALASLLARAQRLLDSRQILAAAGSGARLVLPAIAILWLASTMSRQTGNESVDGAPDPVPGEYQYQDHRLYTGDYVAGVLAASDDAATGGTFRLERWLPTIVFVLAAVVAFSTGTSWGTMGILLPMVIPLTYSVLTGAGQSVDGSNPILLGSVAGVLAGAIFGDHCSPISDTTVLSSQSSGCDHVAHVRTQLPYALLVGAVSILLGTIPVGFGVSVWILLPVSVAALLVLLFLFGRRAET